MDITALVVGRLQANCYIVGSERTKKAVIIDPGGDPEEIVNAVNEKGYDVEYILNTHGHMDHVAGNSYVKRKLGGKLAIHPDDEPMLNDSTMSIFTQSEQEKPERVKPDLYLHNHDEVHCGDMTLKVIHTPGHTQGGVCFLIENHLFSGDTLFAGSVGRWDFPGGSHEDLVRSITEKLMVLDDSVIVYPGHGPTSSIGFEKQHNPFLS